MAGVIDKSRISSLRLKKLLKISMDIVISRLEGLTYYDIDYYQRRFKNKRWMLAFLKTLLLLARDMARKSIKKKKSVKIAIQVSYLSTWIGDHILDLIEKDDRFEITVLIMWYRNSDPKKEIPLLKEHFKNRENAIEVVDNVTPGDFDIFLFTTPYIERLDNFNYKEIPLTTLICYVPYGFLLVDSIPRQFNLFIHRMCWKNYVTSQYYKSMIHKNCDSGSKCAVYSGYPKLDMLVSGSAGMAPRNYLWKQAPSTAERGIRRQKRIIYAPHHSMGLSDKNRAHHETSTFITNHRFFLEYAREHTEETTWIVKPHPLLKVRSIGEGKAFASRSEYEDYMKAWDELPNARVIEGEYMDVFATSDIMVFDSVSFMAEYLYTGKPALFLTNDPERFNEFGNMVYNVLYHARGDDYEAIKYFIETLSEIDPKKNDRDKFFKYHLDYYATNKMLASEYIYRDIVNEVA